MLSYLTFYRPRDKLILQFRSPNRKFEIVIYDHNTEIILHDSFLDRLEKLIRRWTRFSISKDFKAFVSRHYSSYIPGMWEYKGNYRFSYIPAISKFAAEFLNLNRTLEYEKFMQQLSFNQFRRIWIDYPELYRSLEFVLDTKWVRRYLSRDLVHFEVDYFGHPVICVNNRRRPLDIVELLLVLSHPKSCTKDILNKLPKSHHWRALEMFYDWVIRDLEDYEILDLKL